MVHYPNEWFPIIKFTFLDVSIIKNKKFSFIHKGRELLDYFHKSKHNRSFISWNLIPFIEEFTKKVENEMLIKTELMFTFYFNKLY